MAKQYYMRFGFGDPRTYTGLSPTMLFFASAGTTVAPPSITEALPGSGVYTFTYGTTTSIAFLADAATTSPGQQGRYVVGNIDPSDRADEYGSTLVAIGTTNIALGTTNVALGTTNVALGTTGIALGTTNVALGTTILATEIAQGVTIVGIGNTAIALGTSNLALGTSILAQGVTISYALTLLLSQGFTVVVAVGGIGSTASSFGDLNTDPVDLFGYVKRINEILQGSQLFIKPSGSLTTYSRHASVVLGQQTIANSVSTVLKS